jgi:hypothetical protein
MAPDMTFVDGAGEHRLSSVLLFGLAIGFWLLTRHYNGIVGDSRIYIGRALADLAPATIGRDLMFAHDGQAGFSVFTVILRWLVRLLGAPAASVGVAFVAMALGFVTMTALVLRLAPPRLAWAILIFVAVLPGNYGGLSIISFGEALAIPRPFAEAAVLAAMAAMLDGRRLLALGFLIVAGLFHPIMALCGFGVFFVFMGRSDLRWVLAAGVLVGLVLIAAALRLPLANRLFTSPDPQWLDLLRHRNAYLFPGLWPTSTWTRIAVQSATVAISARVLRGRAQALFVAALAVGLVGVLITYVGGDVWPSLLVLQAQPWRALWLVAVLANAGAAICAVGLCRRGALCQIVMILLGFAWLMIDQPICALPAGLAVALAAATPWMQGIAIKPSSLRLAWGLLAACALIFIVPDALTVIPFWRLYPASLGRLNEVMKAFSFLTLTVIPLTAYAAAARPRFGPGARVLLGVAALGLVGFAAVHWGSAGSSAVRRTGPDPSLAAMLKPRPGEVAWISGDVQGDMDAWGLAGRPSWASEIQGASIVFSRQAGLAWQARMNRLIALGLADPHAMAPWDGKFFAGLPRASPGALAALCATPDGPAWIVTPSVDGKSLPAVSGARLWTAPYPTYVNTDPAHPGWMALNAYAVIPCRARS